MIELNKNDRIIYVVSDLHLGDGTATDNFYENLTNFNNFLEFVEKDNGILVLAGDTFEMWQACLGDIIKTYGPLIDKILSLDPILIIGNHDYHLLGFRDILKIPLENYLTDEVLVKINGKEIKIVHGHEFDIFNAPGKSQFIGQIFSLIMSNLEIQYPESEIESWTQRNVEPIVRNIMIQGMKIYQYLFGRSQSQVNGYLKESLDYYRSNNLNTFVIAGHSHRPGWYKDWYVNCGTWQDKDKSYFAKIDKNGIISLFHYPSLILETSQFTDINNPLYR